MTSGNPVPEGKRAMVLGLRVAKDVIRGQPIGYLDTENLVDVLSTQPNVNHFVREMKKLVIELGPSLCLAVYRTLEVEPDLCKQSLCQSLKQLWNDLSIVSGSSLPSGQLELT